MRYVHRFKLGLIAGLVSSAATLQAADSASFSFADLDRIQSATSTFLPSKLTERGSCNIRLADDTKGHGWISIELLKGLCKASQADEETKISAIPHLQSAQRHGLNKQQAQVALLMEGLAHCANLNKSKGTINGKGFPRDMKEQVEVCASRTMAYNAFHHIDWLSLNLRFEERSSEKIEELLDAMNTCEQEFLTQETGGYNAICGIQNIPQGDSLNAAISQAAQEPIIRFLGPTQATVKCDNPPAGSGRPAESDEQCQGQAFLKSGSDSPLGGLMARKILKTKASIERSIAKAEGLKKGAESANVAFDKMDAAFAPVAGVIETHFAEYQGLVVRGQAVREEFDYWSRGLWQEGTTNYKEKYQKSKTDLLASYNSVNSATTNSAPTTVSTIVKNIKAIATYLENEQSIKDRAKRLCAVLFCEIASTAWNAKGKCLLSKATACNEKKSQEYCRAQGFEEQYMVFGLPDDDARTASCRTQYLVPQQLSAR